MSETTGCGLNIEAFVMTRQECQARAQWYLAQGTNSQLTEAFIQRSQLAVEVQSLRDENARLNALIPKLTTAEQLQEQVQSLRTQLEQYRKWFAVPTDQMELVRLREQVTALTHGTEMLTKNYDELATAAAPALACDYVSDCDCYKCTKRQLEEKEREIAVAREFNEWANKRLAFYADAYESSARRNGELTAELARLRGLTTVAAGREYATQVEAEITRYRTALTDISQCADVPPCGQCVYIALQALTPPERKEHG